MLSTNNLSKHYGDFVALDKVSISINKGDIYGLVGKNGAGKTTLFKLVMGLSAPTGGEIVIADEHDLLKARRRIGFMIGQSFFGYLNARENIEYHRRMKGIKDKKETKRVLKLVGLDKIKKPFKSFSMGMKQRLGIANALLGSPDIVVLDEPINGLDPQGISEIRQMIKGLNQKHGTTFIISSHILSELDLVATRFGFIDRGILLREISHQELHKQTQKSLVIEVDNTQKAVELMEAHLKLKNFSVNQSGEIVLEGNLREPDKIAELLVGNGLRLSTLKRQETTLEEYFISLAGHDGRMR
jgi:ABC-2 type transport system ATP-binding protein